MSGGNTQSPNSYMNLPSSSKCKRETVVLVSTNFFLNNFMTCILLKMFSLKNDVLRNRHIHL
jgi:hypothetical protein